MARVIRPTMRPSATALANSIRTRRASSRIPASLGAATKRPANKSLTEFRFDETSKGKIVVANFGENDTVRQDGKPVSLPDQLL
jgi:hypothetical protein